METTIHSTVEKVHTGQKTVSQLYYHISHLRYQFLGTPYHRHMQGWAKVGLTHPIISIAHTKFKWLSALATKWHVKHYHLCTLGGLRMHFRACHPKSQNFLMLPDPLEGCLQWQAACALPTFFSDYTTAPYYMVTVV